MTQTLTPQNAAATIRKYGGIEVAPVSSPDRGVALGLYGPGGVGKTTLAATITDSEHGGPALLLNARGNPHVISSYGQVTAGKPWRRVDLATVNKFAEQEAIRQALIKEGASCPYKTVILDNVSEMWSRRLSELYGPIGDVDWTKHSASTADILQLVRNWMDVADMAPHLNVVFIFQETPETRTVRGVEVKSRSELAFNKALQGQVPTIINFLGRLYQMTDEPPYRRMLDFRPVETIHQAKFQVDPIDPETANIPMEIWDPSLAPLLDTIRYHKPFPVASHTKKKGG